MGNTQQPLPASIILEDGDTEDLLVTPLGSGLYRLEESSLSGELRYQDVIEAASLADGSLRYLRVAAPSESRTLSWILQEAFFDNPTMKTLLDRVMSVGGNWERTLGAVLTIHVPPEHEGSIKADMDAFSSSLAATTRSGIGG